MVKKAPLPAPGGPPRKRSNPLARAAILAATITLGCSLPAAADSAAATAQAPPVSGGSALRIARALRASGDAVSALPIYRELSATAAPDAPLRMELGQALLEAGYLDEAIGVFTAAPGSPTAQLGLARAQLALDQPARALVFADRAAALAPNDIEVLIGRGVILDGLGRHAEAQATYRAALTHAPRSVAARSDLALSEALSGRFDDALEILEPIGRSAAATPRDRQNLAFVYGLKGDTAAARALGRVDLDETTAIANADFLALARAHLKAAN